MKRSFCYNEFMEGQVKDEIKDEIKDEGHSYVL